MTSFYQSLTVNTEVSHVVYVRAEGPKALSPGQRPGLRGSAPYLCFTLRSAIFNSLRPVTVGSGRADCSQLAGIAVYGNAGIRCCCPLTSRTSGGSDNFYNFYNFFNSYNFYNLTSVTEKM